MRSWWFPEATNSLSDEPGAIHSAAWVVIRPNGDHRREVRGVLQLRPRDSLLRLGPTLDELRVG